MFHTLPVVLKESFAVLETTFLLDSMNHDSLRTRKQSVNRDSTRSRASAMIALEEVPDTPVKSTLHEDGCPKSSATRPSEVISERVRINTNCVRNSKLC